MSQEEVKLIKTCTVRFYGPMQTQTTIYAVKVWEHDRIIFYENKIDKLEYITQSYF